MRATRWFPHTPAPRPRRRLGLRPNLHAPSIALAAIPKHVAERTLGWILVGTPVVVTVALVTAGALDPNGHSTDGAEMDGYASRSHASASTSPSATRPRNSRSSRTPASTSSEPGPEAGEATRDEGTLLTLAAGALDLEFDLGLHAPDLTVPQIFVPRELPHPGVSLTWPAMPSFDAVLHDITAKPANPSKLAPLLPLGALTVLAANRAHDHRTNVPGKTGIKRSHATGTPRAGQSRPPSAVRPHAPVAQTCPPTPAQPQCRSPLPDPDAGVPRGIATCAESTGTDGVTHPLLHLHEQIARTVPHQWDAPVSPDPADRPQTITEHPGSPALPCSDAVDDAWPAPARREPDEREIAAEEHAPEAVKIIRNPRRSRVYHHY